MADDRSIRVFVSSTFRDMQEDRDYLVKFVFPQLRKLCEARGVTWGEVDLRWGIPDEEAAEGRVLPLCLEEIHRCRPYFIGLLGERYGWVPRPEEIPDDLLERQEWLRDHMACSVTELEIIHGVFREGQMHGRAFFYFRDRGYLERVPSGQNRPDFECESPEAEAKLERLKQRIRAARDEQVCQLRENYQDAEQLGQWILDDLTELIEQLYPITDQPDALTREAEEHEAFARSRSGVYIGRQEYFDRLDAHVAGDGPPLVVLGVSGLGKSALLANWLLDYRKKHPDDFALIHFIGSTSDSADSNRLMQRIMMELKRRFDLTDEVPVSADKIREEFPQWLDKVAGAGRVVLALDALNQLEDRDNAPDLGWLPVVIPPNCRVILSTLPGRCLDAVRRRQWPEVTVQPLSVSEREELIAKFLAPFGRRLGTERVEHISKAEQTANPLFLRALLDELRQFGEYERLGERIEHYLAAADPGALYERILQRWQQDYGQNLVRQSLSLLWASRRGLSEAELLDLLGEDGNPLPHAVWTPFYLAAESSLAQRSGLLGFFHSYVRDAVQARFVTTADVQRSRHQTLADYFRNRPELTSRGLEELPWQWQQAEEWEQLKDLLTDMTVFHRLRSEECWKWDLQAYWLALAPRYDACDAYRQALDRWGTDANAPGLVLRFFRCLRRPFGGRLRSGRERLFAAAVHELAVFHYERAEHSTAEPLMARVVTTLEKSLGEDHPDVAAVLNSLAALLQVTGRLAEAEPPIRRALAILEKSLGEDHPNVGGCLNNLAALFQVTNRLAEAEPLYRRALTIAEQSYGPKHPDVARDLNNLALLLQATNRLAEAEQLYRRALTIDEQSYGPEHPDVARDLNNLAGLCYSTNRLAEAESLIRRALAISEKSLGEDHPNVAGCLIGLAGLLQVTNRRAEAEPLIRRALAIDEQVYGAEHPSVAICLTNLAHLLQATNRRAEAEPLYRRVLTIDEQSYGPDHPDVTRDLNNLADVLQATNRLAEAEPLFRRALAIDEQSQGAEHPDVARDLTNLASLLQATNRLAEAEPLMRRALAIEEQAYGAETPDVAICLYNLACLLQAANRLAEAEPLSRRAVEIVLKFRKATGHEHPHQRTLASIYERLLQSRGLSEDEVRAQLDELNG